MDMAATASTAASSATDRNPAFTAAMGAVAGAIGVWALDRADWFMWNREAPEAKARTRAARPGGEAPAGVLVSKMEQASGRELSEGGHRTAEKLTHYTIGIGPAVAYAAMRDKLPVEGPARGLLYGFGMFLLQDEGLNTVTGLGGRPGDYPWQDHARGLVAHLVYGLATELALTAMERALDRAEAARGDGAARRRWSDEQ